MFEFSILSFILFTTALLGLLLFMSIWFRRRAPGAIPLLWLLASSFIWVMGNAFEVSAVNLSAIILCGKIEYLGIATAGVFWLLFALDFSGSTWWKRPRIILPLFIIPTLTIIMAWTNDLHGLVWSSVIISVTPLGTLPVWNEGVISWINSIYQYCLYLASIAVLLRFGLRKPRRYLSQIIILLIGAFLPFIGSFIYLSGDSPFKGFDITSFGIFLGAIIYMFIIMNPGFMKVLPIAREALVNSIPEGILVFNEQNKVVDFNSVAAEMLKINKKELTGKSFTEIQSLPHLPLDLSQKDQIAAMDKNGQNAGYLRVKTVDLLDEKNNAIGKMVILTDISELKTAQLKLEALYTQERQLRGSLEQEIQKRSQYTRAVVHELRTPLTSIIASGELLESQLNDTLQLSLINNIQRSAENMEKRVNELFELARGEMGLLDINPEPMDVNILISEVVSEIRPIAESRHLNLRAELAPGELTVMGDRTRLHQILTNLVSNSLKFTEKGQIIIASSQVPDLALIQVRDSGKGINAEVMETLFNPYERTLIKNWTSSGLGIGLALCKIYVELHHGTIKAESQLDKGTTISFTVPLDKR
jgi:signal transduction histidine kinase